MGSKVAQDNGKQNEHFGNGWKAFKSPEWQFKAAKTTPKKKVNGSYPPCWNRMGITLTGAEVVLKACGSRVSAPVCVRNSSECRVSPYARSNASSVLGACVVPNLTAHLFVFQR